MAAYKIFKKARKHHGQSWLPILLAIVVLLIVGVGVVRVTYTNNLKPVSTSSQTVYFTVDAGSSVQDIATNLKNQGLIRSTSAFKNYVRTKELRASLQAGTYVLSPSMNTQQIVTKMVSGDVAKNLLTILPGKRLSQIEAAFKQAGYSDSEIAKAFNPATYIGDSALASLPAGSSLEGYLYPDSFQKTTGTPAETIVQESIDELAKHLTPSITQGFKDHNLTIYQGLTLASIIYQETDDASAQPTVAQVFLSRLAQGMPLESNVTANYAADTEGVARNVSIDSPYNTYLHKELPPGPIGNFTDAVLQAIAHPTNTDYLYFIAGDDGKMHFSRTAAEHEQAITDFCQVKCAQP